MKLSSAVWKGITASDPTMFGTPREKECFNKYNNIWRTTVYLCDVSMSEYLQEVQVVLEVQLHPVQRNSSCKHHNRTL